MQVPEVEDRTKHFQVGDRAAFRGDIFADEEIEDQSPIDSSENEVNFSMNPEKI